MAVKKVPAAWKIRFSPVGIRNITSFSNLICLKNIEVYYFFSSFFISSGGTFLHRMLNGSPQCYVWNFLICLTFILMKGTIKRVQIADKNWKYWCFNFVSSYNTATRSTVDKFFKIITCVTCSTPRFEVSCIWNER